MEPSTKPAIPHGLIAVVLALPVIVIGVQSLRLNHLISGCVLTLAGLGLFTYGVRRADASPALNPMHRDAARRHAPMLLAATVGLLLWAGVLVAVAYPHRYPDVA